LILDEATSALDKKNEEEILNAISNLPGSVTTLIIAHRLSAVRKADKIIVLQKGEKVEEGTHDELFK